jgi:hypothetical protein
MGPVLACQVKAAEKQEEQPGSAAEPKISQSFALQLD